MRLVTPLTDIKDFELLRYHGADEFYAGYIPYEWLNDYFNHLPLNGRERMYADFSFHSSSSIKQLKRVSGDVDIYITLNGHYYNDRAYQDIIKIIDFLYQLGFKKFIIADYHLLMLIANRYIDVDIAISGDMGLFNYLAVEYVMKNQVKRIIFPRKTPLSEMQQIILKTSKYKLEYEAFILNELCYYSGAFCNAYHCDELLRICRLPKKLIDIKGNVITEENFNKKISNLSSNTDADNYILGKSGCGICKMKHMQEIGVTHLKLVGRGKKTEHLVKDIQILNELMDSPISSVSDFENYVNEKIFHNNCPKDCYYREDNS